MKPNRIKYQWYCEKTHKASVYNAPCIECDNNCKNVFKVSIGREISKELRNSVYERDGKTCIVCGNPNFLKLTIDHLLPITYGGTNEEWNLATMCSKCNYEKGNKLIDKYLKLAKEQKEKHFKNT